MFQFNNSNITWNDWQSLSPGIGINSLFPERRLTDPHAFPKAVGSTWSTVSSASLTSSVKSSASSSPVSFENSSNEDVWEEFRNNGTTKDFIEDLTEITGRPWNYIHKKKVRVQKPGPSFCVFCKNNGLPKHEYESHKIRDERGVTTCPVLRKYVCPICRKIGGDSGHTTRYCPENKRSNWGPGRF